MQCFECKLEMEDTTEKWKTSSNSYLFGDKEQFMKHYECKKCGKGEHKMQKVDEIKILPGKTLTPEWEEKLQEIKKLHNEEEILKNFIEKAKENEKLKKLEEEAEKTLTKIEKKYEELHIPELESDLTSKQEEIATKIYELGTKIPNDFWGPDAFTKGKKTAVTSADEETTILRSTRTVRRIIPKKIVEMFPTKINEMVDEGTITIPLNKAEQKLSKEDIDKVAEKIQTHTYELKIKGEALEEHEENK